ncbi:hypothetical protein [Nonomuraea basaltis]|uniref:hypothetical protein n=1 Tax=Nonomuraea basaltis TaxID=2495887 RepID=UPI00110C657F|nr:hypothetical protein [Nonomuraea basaltis]TMR97628.1 hypothetical protein EJK15_17235 [Nonomuraea basaltis]
MKFSGLAARKAAALGASAAVLAALTAGLMASPAQAATAATASEATSGPKVSVSTPKASPRKYEGSCPVKVNFSAKIKVSVKGKTELAYRWLHGDGSKSKVKVVKLTGKGTKTVTAKQSITFKDEVKGWEAIQVLGPKKATSKKGYFSVSCEAPESKIEIDEPSAPSVSAHAWASPSSYVGECTPGDKIDFNGLIKVDRPSWVRYRWVLNGDVVDYGKVKVYDTRKVGFGFSPRESQRGWARLEVFRPDHVSSNRAYYKVWCKDPAPAPAVKVSASSLVTGTNHDGCKVSAHATVSTTGSAKVQWTWSVNGASVLKGEAYFAGAGAKTVGLPDSLLTGDATKGGNVTLTVSGPHNSESITQSYAPCKTAEPTPTATPSPTPTKPV